MKIQNQNQKGFVLITALVFLTILTVAGILSIGNVIQEMRMSNNYTTNKQSSESSESGRFLLETLIDTHVYNRGWPTTIGGTIPASTFGVAIPTGLTIGGGASPPPNWYDNNRTANIDPTNLPVDAVYSRVFGNARSATATANISIYKMRIDANIGAGQAQVAGYEGLGKGASGGGSKIVFYVVSKGAQNQYGQNGNAVTASGYNYIIRD